MKRNKWYYISLITTFLMFVFLIIAIMSCLELKGREVMTEMYEQHYCPYCGQYIEKMENEK